LASPFAPGDLPGCGKTPVKRVVFVESLLGSGSLVLVIRLLLGQGHAASGMKARALGRCATAPAQRTLSTALGKGVVT